MTGCKELCCICLWHTFASTCPCDLHFSPTLLCKGMPVRGTNCTYAITFMHTHNQVIPAYHFHVEIDSCAPSRLTHTHATGCQQREQLRRRCNAGGNFKRRRQRRGCTDEVARPRHAGRDCRACPALRSQAREQAAGVCSESVPAALGNHQECAKLVSAGKGYGNAGIVCPCIW